MTVRLHCKMTAEKFQAVECELQICSTITYRRRDGKQIAAWERWMLVNSVARVLGT